MKYTSVTICRTNWTIQVRVEVQLNGHLVFFVFHYKKSLEFSRSNP